MPLPLYLYWVVPFTEVLHFNVVVVVVVVATVVEVEVEVVLVVEQLSTHIVFGLHVPTVPTYTHTQFGTGAGGA